MGLRNSYIPTSFWTEDILPPPEENQRVSNAYWVNKNDFVSQSFLTTSKYRLTDIKLYLASPLGTGRYFVEIYAADGNKKPTGSVLLKKDLAAGHVFLNGPDWYSFTTLTGEPSSPVLENSTHYVIVLYSTGGFDKDTRLAYSYDTPLSGTAYRSYDRGINWVTAQVTLPPPTVENINFSFKIEGADPEPGIATNPLPVNAGTNQPGDVILTWDNGSVTATVDVFFDDFTPPTTKVIDNLDVSTYNPGNLAVSDTFYWRVDCKNAHGTTTGTIWSFETGPQIAVGNKTELQAMKDNPTAAYYLTANIDISGAWTPIGNLTDGSFLGILDGRDYTVSNLTIDIASPYQGLFGILDGGALVFDLTVDTASIECNGPGGCLAGVVGVATITNVHVTGTSSVTAKSSGANRYWGGFIGDASSNCTIYNCSSSADVTGIGTANYIGGFIGFAGAASFDCQKSFATGSISSSDFLGTAGGFVGRMVDNIGIADCYATGSVDSSGSLGHAGGFVGTLDSDAGITTCYAVGTVGAAVTKGGFCANATTGTITDCYYDSTTTGQSDTGKGIPKITSDMKKLATFVNWSF